MNTTGLVPTMEGSAAVASQRSTALAKLAQMYVDDGNLAAAQQAIEQGLELDPESIELQRAQLAVKAAVAGQTEEEAEHLDTLLLEPEPEPGEGLGRILTLIGCENLRRTDLVGGADPYAVVHLDGAKVGQTNPCHKTTNPSWAEDESGQFALRVPLEGGRLRVQIWDWDEKSAHDFLGQAEFKLGGANGQGGKDAIVPLNSYQLGARKGFVGKDRPKGRLQLTVTEDDLFCISSVMHASNV